MPPASPDITAICIRRSTANDLPSLLALLQLYYSEGDVHHTEDEQSLIATLNQYPTASSSLSSRPPPTPHKSPAASSSAASTLSPKPPSANASSSFPNSAVATSPPASWTPSKTPPVPPAFAGSTSTVRTTSSPPSPCTAAAATSTAHATTKIPRPPYFSAKTSAPISIRQSPTHDHIVMSLFPNLNPNPIHPA